MTRKFNRVWAWGLAFSVTSAAPLLGQSGPDEHGRFSGRKLTLQSCSVPGSSEVGQCGTYEAYEDRVARRGRMISLNIVVLPARGVDRQPDPVFIFLGGPGQTATLYAKNWINSWMREKRDVVFVDLRGTGEPNRLDCKLSGSEDDLQGYLEPIFQPELFRECRKALEPFAELGLYSTHLAVDDLDEVRAALGYDKINLWGGSYGTRAILAYLKRHSGSVRTATLAAIAPVSIQSPLFYARDAQAALDSLFADCRAEQACRSAFPSFETEFYAVMDQLANAPVGVSIPHPTTGVATPVMLSRDAAAETFRKALYYLQVTRQIPEVIHRAHRGDFAPLAKMAITVGKQREALRMGLLASVMCTEDTSHIRQEEIEREVRGTFLGDSRVRRQMAVCDEWPKGVLPADHADPIRANTPVLLFSGSRDPVTPPRWGEEAARHLPNSRHLVLPLAHAIKSDCVDQVTSEFWEEASAESLDASCVKEMKLPAFSVSDHLRSR